MSRILLSIRQRLSTTLYIITDIICTGFGPVQYEYNPYTRIVIHTRLVIHGFYLALSHFCPRRIPLQATARKQSALDTQLQVQCL